MGMIGKSLVPLLLLASSMGWAAPVLEMEQLTWDVIGLDSNKPGPPQNEGPEDFLVGVRIHNTGDELAKDVSAGLNWISNSGYIDIASGSPSILLADEIPAGEYYDFYFNVKADRSDGKTAHEKSNFYNININGLDSSDNPLAQISYPYNHELYIELLVSQNRNSTVSITGDTKVYVGKTYNYHVVSNTATNGYEQLSNFVNFPNVIFQIKSVSMNFTASSVEIPGTNPVEYKNDYDRMYADGCTWINDPSSVDFMSCSGTGKIGGILNTYYQVKILSTGTTTVQNLIYDFSGSSFHYNTDMGDEISSYTIAAVNPPVIEGSVFNDLDGDGIWDIGEPAIPNLEVTITDSNGAPYVVTTDANGLYSSEIYAEGTTTITVTGTPPVGSILTTANVPQTVTAVDATTTTATDIGYQQRGLVTGHVFEDLNGDGAQQAGEPNLPNISVAVTDSYGNVVNVVTDSTGDYTADVAIGSNTAVVDNTDTDLPPAAFLTTNNESQTVTVNPAQTTDTTDVGYQQRNATLSGTVWHDINTDSSITVGEPGFPTLDVTLIWAGPDGIIGTPDDQTLGTTQTASDGTYSFSGLPAGEYSVVVDDSGFADDRVIINTTNPRSTTLTKGQALENVDFGYGDVSFTKSDAVLWADFNGDTAVQVGDVVSFELVITNPSQTTALVANISDPLPSGLTNLDILTSGGGDVTLSTPTNLSVTGITVPAQDNVSIIFLATVDRTITPSVTLTNTASLDVGGNGSVELTDDGLVVTPGVRISAFSTVPSVCDVRFVINTESGNGYGAFAGEDVPAADAQLYFPRQACSDPFNNTYIADYSNHVVRIIEKTTGHIKTIAGIPSSRGFSGDGGPATAAQLALPADVFVRGEFLYIADKGNSAIRKVDLMTGIITTIAGTGTAGFSGDGGPATAAQLYKPESVYVDVAGNVIIADTFNFAIRKIDAATGIIETIVGTGGVAGHTLDGGSIVNSYLEWVLDIVADETGRIYFSEQNGYNLLRYIENDTLYTRMGHIGRDIQGDCGPAALGSLYKPAALAIDTFGNIYIADQYNHKIRMITPKDDVFTIAGTGTAGYSGDGSHGIYAELNFPTGVAIGTDGILHVVDKNNHVIRSINTLDIQLAPQLPYASSTSGNIITVAGTGVAGYNGDGQSTNHMLAYPGGIDYAPDGSIIIADRSNHRIRRVNTRFTMSTIAGIRSYGFSGDGGDARFAQLFFPTDVEVAPDGTIYVSDQYNHVIRAIDPDGIISTFAGIPGTPGSAVGQFNRPDGLAIHNNVLYVSDQKNNRIQAIDLTTGQASVVPGSTSLYSPRGLEADGAGTLFVADLGHHQIVAIAGGTATVFAGTGLTGLTGNGGDALLARLTQPMDVTIDSLGNLYIADHRNHVVRKVDQAGIITTYAGTGTSGFSGSDSLATNALMNRPWGLTVDSNDNLLVTDRLNNILRAITP